MASDDAGTMMSPRAQERWNTIHQLQDIDKALSQALGVLDGLKERFIEGGDLGSLDLLREKIQRANRTLCILAVGPKMHRSGAALFQRSRERGARA